MRLLLLILLLISHQLYAQNSIPVFKKNYGSNGNDEALTITYTSDKGSIVAGRTTSNTNGVYDGFLMKLSENGNIQWSKNYGGPDSDAIVKVKPTADNGYLAVAISRSFGNSKGEFILIKTDANGVTQWSKKYLNNPNGSSTVTDLLQLHNGSFCITVNENNNTDSSDALIILLRSDGSVQWSKRFDDGYNDAFNSIVEQNDSLVIGGHCGTGNGSYEGLLMKLLSADGSFVWAKKFDRYLSLTYYPASFWNNDIVFVDTTSNGIAFSVTGRMLPHAYLDCSITHFKMLNSGEIKYEVMHNQYCSGDLEKNKLSVLTTPDKGFVVCLNDSTLDRYPVFIKIGPLGQQEIGRTMSDLLYNTKLYGFEKTGSDGFLFAGYRNRKYFNDAYKIRIIKTDYLGLVGNCNYPSYNVLPDSIHHIIQDFKWKTASFVSLTPSDVSIISNDNQFTSTTECEDVYIKPAPVFNDTCNTSFSVKVKGDGLIEYSDVVPANDGGYLSIGRTDYNPSFEPSLFKLNANGSVSWSKSYLRFFHFADFKRIIATTDGNFIAFGNDDIGLNHGVARSTILYKLDNAGNILWKTEIANVSGIRITNVLATPNGFVACAFRDFGNSMANEFLIYINNQGQVIWKKEANALALDKYMYLDGNDLYVASDYCPAYNNFKVEKWDLPTGTLKWVQKYSRNEPNHFYTDGITKVGDTIYVAMDIILAGSGTNNLGIVKFLNDGTQVGGYEIAGPNHITSIYDYLQTDLAPSMFAVDSNKNFIVAQQSVENGTQSIDVTKFKPDGTLIWSKNFPSTKDYIVYSVKADGKNILLAGKITLQDVTDFRQDRSFLIRLNNNGNVIENAQGACSNVNTLYSLQSLPPLTKELNDVQGVANAQELIFSDFQEEDRSINSTSTLICNTASLCSKVQIIGVDSICDRSQVYTYKAMKNPDCTSSVIWNLDTTQVQVLAKNDSLLQVQFNHTGSISIRSSLEEGCRFLSSQKEIIVLDNASSLSLGKDSSICPGSQISLHAGSNYITYQWQDGSTDSNYTVNQSGNYWVKVTDKCGRQASDTIIIGKWQPEPLGLGSSIVKCNNDSVQLKAASGFIQYDWTSINNYNYRDSNSIWVNPNMDTKYYLRAEKSPGCFSYDSIQVNVFHSPAINLGGDKSICIGDSVLLDAGSGFTKYLWNDGTIGETLLAKEKRRYTVVATTSIGCQSIDSMQILNVLSNPQINLNHDSTLCEGGSRVLSAGNFASYQWNTGSNNSQISISALGNYSVMVTDNNGCKARDSVHISQLLPSPGGFLNNDTSICTYSTLLLTTKSKYLSYLWSTNEHSSTITISHPGNYWLQVTDKNNCVGRDTIVVNPKNCIEGFYVPTAFTPNNDGKNDVFRPMIFGNIKKYLFTVYNRWGKIIFQSRVPGVGWDGKVNGQIQSSLVFIWTCSYQLEGQPEHLEKGTVTLIK